MTETTFDRPQARPERDRIRYRGAAPEDGAKLHRLVDEGGVLELNTCYSYVLMCDHFGSTTVVAEHADEPVGFVTAYRPPSHPDTVFVWQIGVDRRMRGRGVARGILQALVKRPACRGVRYLEATVTPSNTASRRLFQSFARSYGASFEWSECYPGSIFGEGHEPEELIRIGPFTAGASALS
ncbi:MAG TPA: diaminobutyrate acetyltransferase [Sandaracinaceae bacterium LLY-WYZ-13_1]|nr:diaminobutyrate acetyltransferase [Sandaracinaceae bacterium LLY-WYZ-13_1]